MTTHDEHGKTVQTEVERLRDLNDKLQARIADLMADNDKLRQSCARADDRIEKLIDENQRLSRGLNAAGMWTWAKPSDDPVERTGVKRIAEEILMCATTHDPHSRLLGNVHAKDFARLCRWVLKEEP